MRTPSKKAFGIDICKNAVSFAQLQKKGPQIKVIRAGHMPLAQAVVSNGVVQDPAALTGVLKHLRTAGAFRHSDTVLTICAEPVLLQILNLPDSAPSEVKKIIQNEVRQYAVLPLKNIEMDYCGLKSSDAQTKRVLVGAGQTEHLSVTVRMLEKNNIDVKAIEPAVTAFIRACFNKVIKPAGEKNIMLLLVRDDTLNLCVFEKQRLEFLRTKKFESDIIGSQQRSDWIRGEIESVIQFCELEKAAKGQGWRILVACSPENSSSGQVVGEIRSRISRQNVEITAFENSLMDLAIDAASDKDISPVAAGAAMKLLDEGPSGIRLNLLPKEIVSIRKARKELLVIANAAACLLVLLFLQIAFLGKKSIDTRGDIYARIQKQSQVNILELAESKKDISEKNVLVEGNLAAIQKAVEDRSYHNWAKLLAELAVAVPQTVLIQNLQGRDGDTMEIEGLAVNFEAVSSFVGVLRQNKQISSATLVSAGQNTEFGNGLIDYSIVCSLAQ